MKAIPAITGLPRETARPLEAIKENIEELRGVRGDKIKHLQSTATSDEIINKLNELISRVQG